MEGVTHQMRSDVIRMFRVGNVPPERIADELGLPKVSVIAILINGGVTRTQIFGEPVMGEAGGVGVPGSWKEGIMADRIPWPAMSTETDDGTGRAGDLVIGLARELASLRPWWQRGMCWFVAFCLVNAAAIWWAGMLGLIERSGEGLAMIVVLVLSALFIGAVQSAQARGQ